MEGGKRRAEAGVWAGRSSPEHLKLRSHALNPFAHEP